MLWSEAIRVAVTEGRLDLAAGLDLVSAAHVGRWGDWIEAATGAEPGQFGNNGFTVTALQDAWAAITTTDRGDGSAMHLQRGLQAAVRAGHDTDTVAAIAGSLLGARYGASAVPTQWRRMVHGWPGLRAHDLVELAVSTSEGGRRVGEWPSVASMGDARIPTLGIPHPIDPDIVLGTITDLGRVPELDVQAIVSLCALGLDDIPAAGMTARDHIEFWINDEEQEEQPAPRLRPRRRLVGTATVPRRGQAGARALPSGRPAHPGGRAAVCRRPRCRSRARRAVDPGGPAGHPRGGTALGRRRARRLTRAGLRSTVPP